MHDNTSILLVIISVGCVGIWNVDAFLPNHMDRNVRPTDYTLTDITVDTVVHAVAQYFESSNPDRYNPGNLTGLKPLTPSTLFSAHYGNCISSANFQAAIDDIVNQNLMIATYYSAKSEWHFNADKINQGNSRMISIRSAILNNLNKTNPDYSSTRAKIGEFLHLLQSFYSNTNWIELNQRNNEIGHYADLGITDTLSYLQAPTFELSCKNCIQPISRSEELDCKNNFDPSKFYLFSGYRSNQDVSKPAYDPANTWGKCSHGGALDSSQNIVAIGGINKETSDPLISPHYHLHELAGKLAIDAGVAFFNDPEYGLYNIIGEAKFRRLMNIQVGVSLAMVVDDTGSMGEEIEAVKQQTIEIVNEYRHSCVAPSNYVVSPFNDPETGPLTDTTDPDICIDALSALYAHGGGDCPELALTGLENALHRVLPNSFVYLYTDADEADRWKLSDVLSLAKEKKAILKFILTGTCSRRRRKRDTASAFETLADETGGGVYHATNGDIDDVAGIMKADLRASQVSVLQWNHESFTSNNIIVPVDNTMEELSIRVSTSGSSPKTYTQLVDPQGNNVPWTDPSIDIIVDATREFIFLLNATSAGDWVLQLTGVTFGFRFEVEVSARSLVGFTYLIMEEGQTGALVPVNGIPIAGSNVTLQINVVSPELINSTQSVAIKDTEGQTELLTSLLIAVGGRSAGYYTTAVVTLPHQPFTVSIHGKDSNGFDVLRLQPEKVKVLDFGLELLQDNSTIDDLAPGGEEMFVFLVSNDGSADTFDISLSIAPASTIVTGTVTPTTMTLNSFESAEGVVYLTAIPTSSVGDSVLVTLEVSSQSSGDKNTISMSITLINVLPATELEPVDMAPPTCVIIETSETECTIDMINNKCNTHTWWGRFSLLDDLALVEILVSSEGLPGTNYTLENVHPTNTTMLYNSDCCCPYVNVSISDLAKNFDSCVIDYYAPVQDSVAIDVCIVASQTTLSPSPSTESGFPEPETTLSSSPSTKNGFQEPDPETTLPFSPSTENGFQEPDPEGLLPGALIGIGVAVAVVVIAVAVIIVIYKKTTSPKVLPPSQPDLSMDDALEPHGEDNYILS